MFDFFDQIYPKRVFPVKNEKKTKTKKSFWFSFLFLSFSFHFIFVFVFIFVFIFVFVFLLFFFGFYFLNFTMAPLGHHTGWNTRGVFVGFIVDLCLSLLLNISLQFNISRDLIGFLHSIWCTLFDFVTIFLQRVHIDRIDRSANR